MKKHSWEMMLYYPLGLGLFYAIVRTWLPGNTDKEMFALLWMYASCILAFFLVAYYNKPTRKK